MAITAARLVTKAHGPFANVYQCPFCRFHMTTRHGRPGCGRGTGLRNGSLGVGAVVKHLHAEHPEELAFALALYAAARTATAYQEREARSSAIGHTKRHFANIGAGS
jgi:hypothetical protein